MKQKKSLRQLAKELGVSVSYLSQIRHGKRPASKKVLSKLDMETLSNVKHKEEATIDYSLVPGVGLEPTRITPADFKSAASANSATPARELL